MNSTTEHHQKWGNTVELAVGAEPPQGLQDRIRQRLREKLIVANAVELVAYGSLPRSDDKSKLIDWSGTGPDV